MSLFTIAPRSFSKPTLEPCCLPPPPDGIKGGIFLGGAFISCFSTGFFPGGKGSLGGGGGGPGSDTTTLVGSFTGIVSPGKV